MLLKPGNRKLGQIWTWSIPAVHSCPGRSELCEKLCYASSGMFSMPSVKENYAKNWSLAKSPAFVKLMVKEIQELRPKVVRIHVAGDFYSSGYARKWRSIVRQCRNTVFFTYTRSWQVPAIAEDLNMLSLESNMRLWLSYDNTMPVPPTWKNTRVAFLARRDTDQPAMHVDLVFRSRPKTVKKFFDHDSLVCPHENRVTAIRCDQCQLCYRPASWFRSRLDATVKLPLK